MCVRDVSSKRWHWQQKRAQVSPGKYRAGRPFLPTSGHGGSNVYPDTVVIALLAVTTVRS